MIFLFTADNAQFNRPVDKYMYKEPILVLGALDNVLVRDPIVLHKCKAPLTQPGTHNIVIP